MSEVRPRDVMPGFSAGNEALALYQRAFGTRAQALGRAPGRVNIIGEHVDYSGGYVLPMAIDREAAAAAGWRRAPGLSAVTLMTPEDRIEVDHERLVPHALSGWGSYVAGVVAGLHAESRGVQIAIASSVPPGSGLSSSASLEVAVAMAVLRLSGRQMDRRELALACQRAEHEYAGVPCGIMDQYIACFGRSGCALLIDCERTEHHEVPIAPGAAFVVAHCGEKHELGGTEYPARRSACERALMKIERVAGSRGTLRRCTSEELQNAHLTPEELACAGHAVSENSRTLRCAAAIETGDWKIAGTLMNESHASLRDDYRVSCGALDRLVDLATRTAGVYGARMTGGGFGGCIIALAARDAAQETADRLMREGGSPMSFVARAMEGASADGVA